MLKSMKMMVLSILLLYVVGSNAGEMERRSSRNQRNSGQKFKKNNRRSNSKQQGRGNGKSGRSGSMKGRGRKEKQDSEQFSPTGSEENFSGSMMEPSPTGSMNFSGSMEEEGGNKEELES
jgi:hypothetical protein